MKEFKGNEQHQARGWFNARRQNVDSDDVKYAAEKGARKIHKLNNAPPAALAAIWTDIRDMAALLRDFVKGEYRDVPWGTITAVAAALLYFINPIDIIPDFLPVIGFIDDALVLALALKLIGGDLDKYRSWRKNRTSFDFSKEEIIDADFEDISESLPR